MICLRLFMIGTRNKINIQRSVYALDLRYLKELLSNLLGPISFHQRRWTLTVGFPRT